MPHNTSSSCCGKNFYHEFMITKQLTLLNGRQVHHKIVLLLAVKLPLTAVSSWTSPNIKTTIFRLVSTVKNQVMSWQQEMLKYQEMNTVDKQVNLQTAVLWELNSKNSLILSRLILNSTFQETTGDSPTTQCNESKLDLHKFNITLHRTMNAPNFVVLSNNMIQSWEKPSNADQVRIHVGQENTSSEIVDSGLGEVCQ